MSDLITKEQLARAMPSHVKTRITDELTNGINKLLVSTELRENFRDNILGFTSVMADGKYKIYDYINAVKYVSYKLLGNSNIEAYVKTFPERYERYVSEGSDEKTISAYVSAYNKNKLVNLIYEQTLVPTHVLNADIYQKAINTQAYLMMHAKSEKVRSDAANSLLSHLKRPETQKIELDIGVKEDKSIDELRRATMELAIQQRKMIESGMYDAREIAHSKIINEAEYEEV
jgi:hypothetical protein